MPALTLLLPVLVACSGQPEPPAQPEPAPAPPAQPAASATKVHMKSHFLKAYEAKDAVIAGQQDKARPAMEWLATHTEESAPDSWAPYVDAMQAVAAVGAQATDLIGSGAAVAGVAESCGSCHAALNTGPKFEAGEPPVAEPGDTKAHMARHQWAADRLWEGLVGPDADAWSVGASVLTEDASLWSDAHGDLPDGVQELADEVHRLGQKAASATDPDSRAEAYAELLLTCAACHSTVHAGPGKGGGAPTP